MSFEDKVKGVVFATAYGDALGATIEKLTHDEIKEKYGEVRSLKTKWYKADWAPELRLNRMRGNGIVTDDTLMTVALIQTYLKEQRHIDCWDMGNEFVRQIVYVKRYIPEFGKPAVIQDRLFYPEKYIFQRHVLANCEPREGGLGNMVNCGAAMYIAPIGIVNAGNPQAAYSEAIQFACGHQVSYGLEAAGVLAACVAEAFKENATIDSVIKTALAVAKDGTKAAIQAIVNEANHLKKNRILASDEVVDRFHKVIKAYSPMGDDVNRSESKLGIPSNHYTPSRLFSIEELPIALGYLALYENFSDSIVGGINSGRDTDSIGVMIGVICGALFGKSIISEEDQALLESANKLELEKNATEFASVAKQIISKDIEAINAQKKVIG